MKEMVLRCIHLSLSTAVILSAAQVFAYPVTVKNATWQEIKVKIDYAVCPASTHAVKAGETKTIETGGCCSKLVTITGGTFSGTYTPPDTGFWMACRGYSITVSLKKQEEQSSMSASAPTSFDASMLSFDPSSISSGFLIEEGIH